MRTALEVDRMAPARGSARTLTLSVRLLGAALLLAMAWIHLTLWLDGFRDIPWIGPLFLANVVLGTLAAVAVLAVFGYHEFFGGYVLLTILVEAAGFLVLAGYGAAQLLRSVRRGRAVGSRSA